MIKFLAALPQIQSAIKIGGEGGDCIRIQLDCYLTPNQIAELVAVRGKELSVSIE